jgi:hypothetical protein
LRLAVHLVRLLFRAIQDGRNPLDVSAHDDRPEPRQKLLVHGPPSSIAGLRLRLADVTPEAMQAFLVARSARVPYHVFLLNRPAPAIAGGHSGSDRPYRLIELGKASESPTKSPILTDRAMVGVA